jgi:hypothetical protein
VLWLTILILQNGSPEFDIAQYIDKLNRNELHSPDTFVCSHSHRIMTTMILTSLKSAQHILNPNIPSADYPIPTIHSEAIRGAVEEFIGRLDQSVALRVQNMCECLSSCIVILTFYLSGHLDPAPLSQIQHVLQSSSLAGLTVPSSRFSLTSLVNSDVVTVPSFSPNLCADTQICPTK